MIAQPDVDRLILQTKQYEFTDGLRDLLMAVVWASMGLTSWFVFDLTGVWFRFIARLIDIVGDWAKWTSMLLVFLPALAGCCMLILTTYVRQRWLWRESGTVRPLRRITPLRVSVISAVIWLGSVLLSIELRRRGLVDDLFVLRMLVTATSWATGYSLVALGRHIALPRYVWLGAVGGLAPTPALFLPLTFGQVWLVFGVWWGFVLAASGAITLYRRLVSMQGAGSVG